MRKLLEFLVRKRHWFLFLFLEIIAFVLIYHNSSYQRSVLLSTANTMTGNVVSMTGSVQTYLNLKEANKELLIRNGELEMELFRLRSQVEEMVADTLTFKGFATDSLQIRNTFPYDFITAKVVNNSVSQLSNYITLNKGHVEGVEVDMGVVSDKGIVGIIIAVSDHYSLVMSFLNPKFRVSAKVLGSSYFGTTNWNGRSPRYVHLDELPRHVDFFEGDTIVTSAYSAAFPEGIIIGTVSSFKKQNDDNFYSLEVELATDMHALDNVKIIRNYDHQQIRELERSVKEKK